MVVKSKTTAQIRNWFASEWLQIVNDYAKDYEAGNLNRLEKMFKGLSGETGIYFQTKSHKPTKT